MIASRHLPGHGPNRASCASNARGEAAFLSGFLPELAAASAAASFPFSFAARSCDADTARDGGGAVLPILDSPSWLVVPGVSLSPRRDATHAARLTASDTPCAGGFPCLCASVAPTIRHVSIPMCICSSIPATVRPSATEIAANPPGGIS